AGPQVEVVAGWIGKQRVGVDVAGAGEDLRKVRVTDVDVVVRRVVGPDRVGADEDGVGDVIDNNRVRHAVLVARLDGHDRRVNRHVVHVDRGRRVADACAIFPTLSVIATWSNVIVELVGRSTGPLPVCPPPGELPACEISVYW